MVGKTMAELWPAEFAAKMTADDWTVVSAGKVLELEEELDGRRYTTIKFPIIQGDKTLLAGYTIDITERKQAEEALRESEERYRRLIDSAPDWIWEVDEHGRYVFASPKMLDLLGYRPEEVLGKTPFDLMPPDEAERVAALFASIAAKREPFRYLVNTNLHKDGHLVFMETSGTPVFDSNGDYRGYRGMDRDITERKQAEENLARLSRHNELILGSAAEGILGLDAQGNHTFVNPSAARMLGYEAEELLGRPSHSLWHHTKPDGSPYPEEECKIHASFRDGVVHRVSSEVFWRKDGTSFPVEYTSTPIIEQGRVVGAVVTFTDISERKQTEEALRASEERYQTLVNLSPDATIVHIDRKWVFANPAAARLFGADSPAELVGQDMLERVHPDYRELAAQRAAQVSAGAVTKPVEIKSLRLDGTAVDVEANSARIEFDGLPANQVVMRDITERKQTEEALRESEEKHRRLFETMTQGVVYQAENGAIVSANPAAERILGLSLDQMMGRTSSDPGWEATREDGSDFPGNEHPAMVALRTGEPVYGVTMQVRDSVESKRRWITVDAIPQFLPGETAPSSVYTTFADITERKQAEEALRQSEEQLRQSQKMEAVGQLAGGIAHDFNNLLTAILGYSDLILASEDLSVDEVRPDIEEIKHAGERASALTQQILAFSRRQILRPTALSLNEVLDGMESLLRRTLGENIDLVTLTHPHLDLTEVDRAPVRAGAHESGLECSRRHAFWGPADSRDR